MKVVVLGAAGKLGRRLVASCLARGHVVTAAVRNPDRIGDVLGSVPATGLRVVAFDGMDPATLDAALEGQDAMISAAGTVADGPRFVDLFDRVVTSAERVLGPERRIWMLAGAGALDIPHAGRIAIGLPFVPPIYQPHLDNWRRLERSRLDWALMCPGSMVAGDDQPVPEGLEVSVNSLPFAVGAWARFAPPIALSLVMKRNLGRLRVPYRGVADVIADGLAPGGRFSRRRVGIGWSGARGDAGAAA